MMIPTYTPRRMRYEIIPPTNPFEKLRAGLQLSQKEIATRVGCHHSQWAHYEGGKRLPTLRSWIKMKRVAKENDIELSDDMLDIEMESR